MKTRWLALVLALFALVGLSGCGQSASGNADAIRDDGSVDLSQVTLRVGDQKGGSLALLEAAGELDDLPYRVEWKQFTSGPPLLEALNAGAIDVGAVGNTPPLFAAAAKSKITVVSGATMGASGDAIVVPPDSSLTSVQDLAGKDIAVAKGSSANYNLLAQLDKAGVDIEDVTIKYLQPADALAAFSAGHVDAWAIWDPYTAQAEIDEKARVLVDGEGLVNGYLFNAANPASLKDKATATALKDYLTRITRAQRWSNTHRPQWSQAWAEETGLDRAITDRAVGRRLATPVPIDDKVLGSEQTMADAFVAASLLPEKFDVADFFTDDYNDVALAATKKE